MSMPHQGQVREGIGAAPGEWGLSLEQEFAARMPARIRLTLTGPAPPSPHRHANGLRGLVLGAIGRAMPALAAAIHNANQPNPLTVSPMVTDPDDPGTHTVEIGCVADEVVDPLMRGLRRIGPALALGRTPYELSRVEISRRIAFDELASSPNGRTIRLRLLTPTAHHAPGLVRRSVVVPDPVLYFGSWLRRWNLYAPEPFAEMLMDAVATQIGIRGFQGGTQMLTLDRGRVFIGFTGTVEFAILDGPIDVTELAAAAWALARLAEYCGTGVETMRGMGQTRLVRAPRVGEEHADEATRVEYHGQEGQPSTEHAGQR